VRASGGEYARSVEALAQKFPTLTTMELRVCALVKDRLPSWRIAEILGISEKTVENHRVSARRKMKIRLRKPITPYLAMR
jgi:DNA-binding CsgD family transcriptional regulator